MRCPSFPDYIVFRVSPDEHTTPIGAVEVLLPPVRAGWADPTGACRGLGEHTASVLAWLRDYGQMSGGGSESGVTSGR
jgi:hypothetical protein